LAKQEIPELNHFPYSPDLSAPDIFYSSKSNPRRKGEDFKTWKTLIGM
jgi:hypothetical protein